MDADVEEEIMDLGKYYNHYLQGLHPVSITYGGVPVDGKNILQSDEGKTVSTKCLRSFYCSRYIFAIRVSYTG